MFFIKTEERVVTRKDLLSKGLCHYHKEYLTSVVFDDENREERERARVGTGLVEAVQCFG